MLFALAKTQGGRPETITTAAMSNDSPRTSAFPAPSLFPHCEPSTSQGIGATSPDASTGSNADNHTAGASQITFEDYDDVSSDDDYHMSGSTFTMALGHYFFERNLIETPKYYLVSKAVIEYVNLKFIENNFRTLGLDEMFDKDNIMKAEMEFESFEVWFSHLRECAIYRDCICDLRLPLFCHLYLNLYLPRNHARLQAFLRTFKYLFSSENGAIYLEELQNVTDVLNLSPRLAYFRRNKFVYGVSPMFINDLYDFFQLNFMLQVVFQEWIDINYITHENPKMVLEEYYSNNLERENNLNKANAPKINDKNDNVNSFGTVLCKKTLNSSQKKNNNCKVNNSESDLTENSEESSTEDQYPQTRSRRSKKLTENSEPSSTVDKCPEPRSRRSKKIPNERKKCRKHRKKHKLRCKKNSSNNNLHESSNETSNNDKLLRKKIKSFDRRKTTSDQNSRSCEKLSEVSDEEKKNNERQMKTGKSKSISDDNMQMSGLSDMSNDDEKKQKRQNKRSKIKSTSDDNNRMSEDQESPNKDKEHHKSNARRKYERINISLSDSCSAGDSLEDSSSLYSSSYDEEISMRKFIRKVKKKKSTFTL